VEVADGYARNFLLPKQLAVLATPGRVRSLAQLTAQAKNWEDRSKREATSLAERLATLQISLQRRASEDTPLALPVSEAVPTEAPTEGTASPTPLAAPKLFGSVTSQDLTEALAAKGFGVDKKKILLDEPIKTLGVHRVPVRLHAEVTAEFTVIVEREA